jgi:hypothetical protein
MTHCTDCCSCYCVQAEIYLHSIYSLDTAFALGHSLTDMGVEVCATYATPKTACDSC